MPGFLSDNRYEQVSVLYETEHTAVYLVRHLALGELRILKRIRVTDGMSGICQEAAILKDLRHPGIPVLYDYEDDGTFVWMVEEYVEGIALSDYLAMRSALTTEQICSFLVQVCEIIQYLHQREPFPILYQDLKPEHLFLRGEQLVLIDYGAALYAPRSGTTFQKYGTPPYCAPELLASGTTSIQSDIYSVGCIAKLLVDHTTDRVPRQVRRLIRWACQADPSKRPDSIESYLTAWSRVLASVSEAQVTPSPATIVVTGTSSACGTTHVALSLTVYLNATGRTAYYQEQPDKSVTQQLCQECPGFHERDLVIYHHHFRAILNTGDAVQAPAIPDAVRVVDAGCDHSLTQDADLTICVIASRPWLRRKIDLAALPDNTFFLVNPSNRFTGGHFAQDTGRTVLGFPQDADAFALSRQKRKLFQRIVASAGL